MELYVFFNKSDMPEPHAWQKLITDAAFSLQIDTDFDPATFTGFLPCTLEDRHTGFEYYFAPSSAVATHDTYLKSHVGDLDSVITFAWGGDLREMCAVMMAAGALSASVPSWIYFAEDDSTIPGTQALPYARQQIAEAQKYMTS